MKYMPTGNVGKPQWSHTANLPLADDDPLNADPIDIIIGAELYNLLILECVHKGRHDEPIAQNTTLG